MPSALTPWCVTLCILQPVCQYMSTAHHTLHEPHQKLQMATRYRQYATIHLACRQSAAHATFHSLANGNDCAASLA